MKQKKDTKTAIRCVGLLPGVRANSTRRQKVWAWARSFFTTSLRTLSDGIISMQLVPLAPHQQRPRSRIGAPFVPDNLKGLLRELPSLPSQYAILLGWASELPVMVKMNNLPKWQQPHSDDPDFWNVWTGKDDEGRAVERNADWQSVADDWQGIIRKTNQTE